ncbi:MAG: glycosyltransferase family 4 protein [Pseudomonadota bacterium]|nr:glycosyltransferase family 4 protein [Gammaproteobacteria bacterium]MBU1558941.1 glycosyltransferase family 4 protein [Gammaproteobacteria bacterium]MBU1628959.1 glycosyltransferase family 4 protein [Gammaproteobacteria bacterium]MBU1927304.1 glycosyltransferase family 4 protein [Gammaproteobacteria bacterium]MBU2546205.1 glycosyltransferase family 4 protein [Gammaproteobacteria bacterium]
MRVCVSVKGRFHAFYLAYQLQKYGFLQKLITSYPKFETQKYGIKREKIISLFLSEVLERMWKKLPLIVKNKINTQYFFHEFFDRRVARHIPNEIDLFVAFSSNALNSISVAHQRGAKTILERGSSHIQYQYDVLVEEYSQLHLPQPTITHPRIIQKELREYEVTDFISVPSNFVKQTLMDKGIPARKIIHVPYGVNLMHFSPHKKEDGVFRILFCGNRSVRKGVIYLLQAFTELKLPNAELWFIGSQDAEIEPIIKKYASPQIYFKGPFPEFELAKYYSQCSIFCLPSLEEGLAMVIPQAMACGLPVICTTNTGGGDIVRDGQDGFVIPIRDVEALKEKILKLYEDNELREKMGRSARERVQTGYTWDDYGHRMIVEYQRILGSDKQ